MALSALQTLTINRGAAVAPLRHFPAAASALVYGGSALGFSGGYVRPLVSGDPFAGMADDAKNVDNSGGAAGDKSVGVIQSAEVLLAVTGATAVTDQGSIVYATDDNTFTLTPGGSAIGEVVQWVSGTNCYVRIYGRLTEPNEGMRELTPTVALASGSRTLTRAENGAVCTNEGAGGAVTYALPPAVKGLSYVFCVLAAQELRIDPNGSETIALPSTGAQSAAGKYISADAIGEWVAVRCVKTGEWQTTGFLGTWTAES